MLVTNTTNEDYWFGPLHLGAGIGTTLTVDDTSATSLYLTDDAVADALNNLYNTGMISVSDAAEPFPRPTGVPEVLHGDGSPEGRVFAPQGSAYMRRDNTGASSSLYVKTTGVTISTGWLPLSTATIAVPTGVIHQWPAAAAPTDWLLCDGSAVSRTVYSSLFGVVGTTFGAGDGTSTFNVPDLRGRVPAGYAASGGHTDVSTLGNNEGSALANRRPKHPHTVSNSLTLPNHVHSVSDPGHIHAMARTTGSSGGGVIGEDAHEDRTTDAGDDSSVIRSATTGISIGNPTSSPTITGSLGVGAAGTANDAPAYLVLNHIIKT